MRFTKYPYCLWTYLRVNSIKDSAIGRLVGITTIFIFNHTTTVWNNVMTSMSFLIISCPVKWIVHPAALKLQNTIMWNFILCCTIFKSTKIPKLGREMLWNTEKNRPVKFATFLCFYMSMWKLLQYRKFVNFVRLFFPHIFNQILEFYKF